MGLQKGLTLVFLTYLSVAVDEFLCVHVLTSVFNLSWTVPHAPLQVAKTGNK